MEGWNTRDEATRHCATARRPEHQAAVDRCETFGGFCVSSPDACTGEMDLAGMESNFLCAPGCGCCYDDSKYAPPPPAAASAPPSPEVEGIVAPPPPHFGGFAPPPPPLNQFLVDLLNGAHHCDPSWLGDGLCAPSPRSWSRGYAERARVRRRPGLPLAGAQLGRRRLRNVRVHRGRRVRRRHSLPCVSIGFSPSSFAQAT